ncbi:ABC transporter domain containing protein [Teredinibacter turnerae T7901]|uniref:ABC transporter domain containing protein n=1 Tax=Teredinibacter turnerae (strain ATCC 39867 / T7901) TaxID=377629 RepID=C5BU46_TERTT|nr:ATP-binding cassette domain-containing protein [Teredinibacter turnerae]ACR13069.1 ABC transporter domain containing protein [Teredinibacter turnerae T7901]
MIKTEDLRQQVPVFDGVLDILKGINLHIQHGESVAIVGSSGSGKSTLLGMLAGLDVPSSGTVLLDGEDITRLDEEARAKVRARLVSFVFQNFQLLGSLTALENVMLPLEVNGFADAAERARNYLHKVGLSAREHHYPRQLSGGEQQRVALARAFSSEAPILFADEPTGNLDAETGHAIADLLFSLNEQSQTTLVLVTHDTGLARRCQRQLKMRAGQLEEIRLNGGPQ